MRYIWQVIERNEEYVGGGYTMPEMQCGIVNSFEEALTGLSNWHGAEDDPAHRLYQIIPMLEETVIKVLKPFERVVAGDKGTDYGDEPGEVIATGDYDSLKQYDSTGACQELRDDPDDEHMLDQMVAIKDANGDELLYVYGPNGFSVYEEKSDTKTS